MPRLRCGVRDDRRRAWRPLLGYIVGGEKAMAHLLRHRAEAHTVRGNRNDRSTNVGQ